MSDIVAPMGKLSERLALHRPELRAWAMYDWANSAFVTVVITAVFPIFFAKVAAAELGNTIATSRHAMATAIALTIIAILSPILGAVTDVRPLKKKFLAGFMAIGVIATAAMATIGHGDWLLAAVLFGVANIGVSGSFVFYDALLPHIAKPSELDRLSAAGYALGYVGGGLLLVVILLMTQKPALFGFADSLAATRTSFVIVAVWWLLFAIPLFLRVPEPAVHPKTAQARRGLLVGAFAELAQTFGHLRRYRQAMLFLLAFLVYNDGIGTIIKMATIYGETIGLETSHLIIAVILVQFVGIPCTFVFGGVAGRLGTKKAIFIGLAIYCGVSILGYFMTSELHFYLLAALVGMVQGGVQALSRSLFASMIPRDKSSEFFGLFAVFEKFAGIFGPLVFTIVIELSGSARNAVLAVIGFFIVGAALLTRVDVAAGQKAVAAQNAAASPEPT